MFSALDVATDARLRAALASHTQDAAVLIVAVWRGLPETHPPAARLPLRPPVLLRGYLEMARNPRFLRLALASLRAPPVGSGGRAQGLPKARSYEVSDTIRDRLHAAVPMPTGGV